MRARGIEGYEEAITAQPRIIEVKGRRRVRDRFLGPFPILPLYLWSRPKFVSKRTLLVDIGPTIHSARHHHRAIDEPCKPDARRKSRAERESCRIWWRLRCKEITEWAEGSMRVVTPFAGLRHWWYGHILPWADPQEPLGLPPRRPAKTILVLHRFPSPTRAEERDT